VKIVSTEKPVGSTLGKVEFAHGYDPSSKEATSFFTLRYDIYGNINQTNLQVHNVEKYHQYIKAIKSYKCKLATTGVPEVLRGSTIYRGATTTFVVDSHQDIAWRFTILPNDLYDYRAKRHTPQ